MWHEAVIVFEHHPAVGVGYGALESSAAKLTPSTWPRSPLAHNDYFQALAEGGLLLGVPFLGGRAAIGVGLLRGLRSRARRRVLDVRTGADRWRGALMAHAAIDFDWTYPALFTLAAIVSAAAIAPELRRPDRSNSCVLTFSHPTRPRVRVALVAVLAIAIAAGGVAGHRGGLQLGIKSTSPGTIATTGAGIG